MDLFSFHYAAFVLVTAFLFHVCAVRSRALFLSVASLLFYGFYSPVSAGVLLIATAGVFLAARALDRQEQAVARRRMIFVTIIILLLSYLLLIKLLPSLYQQGWALSTGHFLVALGVSYYTFKLMGYAIDVYWRKYTAWTDPAHFIAFATFFPQLPAGPIQRAHEFRLPDDGQQTAELMTIGLRRILLGVVKKTVIADQLDAMIAYIDGLQPRYSNLVWIAACLYALQMYFDFAALTDIAIGTAALFGIRSPENFAYPFFAPSISKFWRRWHMTLTFWLTDYVFTPLRMATRHLGNWGLAVSITINMVLIGLWHGLSVGFLLFGLIHSIFLIVDSFTASARKRFYRKHPFADGFTNLIGPFFVFGMAAFALVFFRAETLSKSLYQMSHIWEGLGSPITSLLTFYYGFSRLRCAQVCLATTAAIAFELGLYLRSRNWKIMTMLPEFSRLPLPMRWAVYYAGLAIAVTFHQQSVHFIYVQF
jgi:alginate O-acetyltransferase complex protein AlgI